MKKNKVIDVHHHVFPPDHAVHKWDIQSDIAAMERCGVTDVYLSCPLVTDSSTAHSFNEYMASQVKVCPEHYKMLGALPYDNVNAALDEISYILDDLGAPGFGLNTHNHDIYMGDDSLDVIFEEDVYKRQAIVMVTLDLPDTIKQIVMTLGRLGFDEAAAENRRKWQRLC